jgi:glycosyltransferase involved in cell wall biosynthesis
MSNRPGISVVICCHNSAQRLPKTLAHLAGQTHTDSVDWEVIVVDNASTDETAAVATSLWPAAAPAPLKVVAEPQAGLTFARWKGITEARYPILIFVDDDNWLDPEYVSRASRIMEEHPEVGVCNGFGSPVFDEEPPAWFREFQACYAVSNPDWPTHDVTEKIPVPFGAGMVIRKCALLGLKEQGFEPLLTDRTGTKITSGGDTELCVALSLSGWRWWRDAGLQFQHYMPKGRINWRYCLKLAHGGGASYTMLDLYQMAAQPAPASLGGRLRESWFWAAKWSMEKIVRQPGILLRMLMGRGEGDPRIFQLRAEFGRLEAVIQTGGRRRAALARLRAARWIARKGGDIGDRRPRSGL